MTARTFFNRERLATRTVALALYLAADGLRALSVDATLQLGVSLLLFSGGAPPLDLALASRVVARDGRPWTILGVRRCGERDEANGQNRKQSQYDGGRNAAAPPPDAP